MTLQQPHYIYRFFMTRAIDGDTIVGTLDLGFDIKFFERKFRLAGIDTPEMNSKDPAQRAKAQAARDFVKHALDGNTSVVIQTIKSKAGSDAVDSFGRYLAIVCYTDPDGVQHQLNEQLLELGLAEGFIP